METIVRFFTSHFDGMRPRRLILGLSLLAALLSWGCPQQDPLQAFNSPKTPPGGPAPAPVPEPATSLLFGAALLIGGRILRRRRNGNPPVDHSRK
jgi:hypothetical protein